MAEQPIVTLGAGAFVLALGALIRFARMDFLIAGVGAGGTDEVTVDVVGEYTLLVGLATIGLGALSYEGVATTELWTLYGAAVGLSAVTLPFWAGPYYRLTPRRSGA